MTCQCGRLIFPGECYGGSSEEGYTCSNCILAVQVGLEQKAVRRLMEEQKMIEGEYLLIIDNGLDGHAIKRYPTSIALVKAIREGENYGSPFIIAQELNLLAYTGDKEIAEIINRTINESFKRHIKRGKHENKP